MKTQTTVKGDTVLHARTTLVFYHRDGATVTQLDKGKPLVVGRTAPADIEIPDPGLSRRHASFTWDELGVWVEDLDSTNGTKKNGERVTRTLITPTDEISIGPVRVSIHILSSMDEQLRGFDGHDRFVSLLEDEITRARQFQRPLALMMITGPQGKEGHVSRWASRLRPRLRPVDRVGIYGPSAVMVMLPEPSQEMLHTLASALAGDGTLSCGVVLFPNDGQSGEELIAALRSRRVDPTTLGPADVTPIVAKTTAMKSVMATVKRLSQSTIAVLLHGETGSGKEVIARAIHDGGPRRKQVMRCINCAAIPGTLIESVLFGHDQGAFTGADKSAPGMFEQAHGGTILLDEIGELAASAQAALLRVLETKRLMRVGGNKEIEVDVRVIAATHRNLEAMVQAGQFRQDLLYRLNTMTLQIPPLRERVDEIRPLAERFLKEARAQSGSEVKAIDPQAMAALEAYSWPGNVRELRNAIERAVVLAEGKAITLDDLADRIRQRSLPAAEPDASGELPTDYKDHLRKYEAELILRALHKHNGNQTETAKALNLPLRTLVHKIQTYGIKKKFDR